MPKWQKNGWKTVNHKAVKNKKDLVRLNDLCQQVDVQWVCSVIMLFKINLNMCQLNGGEHLCKLQTFKKLFTLPDLKIW